MNNPQLEIFSEPSYLKAVRLNALNHYDQIYCHALSFIREAVGDFTSEDIRKDYKGVIPKEPRVYGSLMRDLSKAGLIEAVGFTKYKDPIGHGRDVRVWRRK